MLRRARHCGSASKRSPGAQTPFEKFGGVVALRLAIPGGRTSPIDFATAALAAMVSWTCQSLWSCDQEAHSSSEDSSSSGSDSGVTLYFTNSGGRPSPYQLLWTKNAQLHQKTLRVRILSCHCAMRIQEAEFHQWTRRLLKVVVPIALDQEGSVPGSSSSPEDSASADSDVPLHCTNPG